MPDPKTTDRPLERSHERTKRNSVWLLVGIVGLISIQALLLSPKNLEEDVGSERELSLVDLLAEREELGEPRAPGVPYLQVPEYSIDAFDYISVSEQQKRWRIKADHADIFQGYKLVHTRKVRALLYGEKGEETHVTGDEAKFRTDSDYVEFFGNVTTRFPDGFEIQSEHILFTPNEKTIEVDSGFRVHGKGWLEKNRYVEFDSNGFRMIEGGKLILLPQAVDFRVKETTGAMTRILSDRGEISRERKEAFFTMNSSRPATERFAKLTQPDLFMRARQMHFRFGARVPTSQVLTAQKEVYLEERSRDGETAYATSDQAQFDQGRSLVILTGFPQVYQAGDTITGDTILFYRDTDIVEIENGNAYSAVTNHHKLVATGIRKSYKGRLVVKNVDIEVESGQVVGLLGPNGAGKTTSFYMIVGLVTLDSGKVELDGEDIGSWPMHIRAQRGVAYLPQEPSVFRKLTVEENIWTALEVLKMPPEKRRARLAELIEEFRLNHVARQKAYTLSGGERRRVEVARALALNPKFILLDEPFAGVDPLAVAEIQATIRTLKARGMGVLITDHNVRETLSICDLGYLLSDGTISVKGTAEEIISNPIAQEKYLGKEFQLK